MLGNNKQSIIKLSILVLILLPSVVSASGLVAYYSFDGDTLDHSGNGNDGASIGDITFEDGVLDQSIRLDGVGIDDYVEVADNSDFSFGDGQRDYPFTFSAWIKRDSVDRDDTILAKYNSYHGYPSWTNMWQEYGFAIGPDNSLQLTIFDPNSNGDTDLRKGVATVSTINNSCWVYVAATYDGSTTVEGMKLFIDGIEQTTTISNNDPRYVAMHDTGEPFRIGASVQRNNVKSQFAGLIDEVKIYNRALSEEEISEEYQSGVQCLSEPKDTTPPTTEVSLFGTLGDNDWYVSDVEITLTASDNEDGSGVATTYYSLDGGEFVEGASLTVTDEGEHALTYYSVDNVGNEEDLISVSFNIDKTAPVISIASPIAAEYVHSESVEVVFSAVDDVSGVLDTKVYLDGSLYESSSMDLMYLALGTHTLTVESENYAGLVSTESAEFDVIATIDSLPIVKDRLYELGEIDNEGIMTSLNQKLAAAKKKIDAGQNKPAVNILEAFISEVEVQRGKHISESAADLLTIDAEYVISNL